MRYMLVVNYLTGYSTIAHVAIKDSSGDTKFKDTITRDVVYQTVITLRLVIEQILSSQAVDFYFNGEQITYSQLLDKVR